MVTVPAFVWRGGFGYRALSCGLGMGALLGLLAWLDSGLWLSGVCVLLIMGGAFAVLVPRRMNRYWPGAAALTGADRVAVVRAARRGAPVAARLVPAAGDYARGLRAAAAHARPLRWLVRVVLVVAVGVALWDAGFGSVRDAVLSGAYVALLLLELFWWPGRRDLLLAAADRTAGR